MTELLWNVASFNACDRKQVDVNIFFLLGGFLFFFYFKGLWLCVSYLLSAIVLHLTSVTVLKCPALLICFQCHGDPW